VINYTWGFRKGRGEGNTGYSRLPFIRGGWGGGGGGVVGMP